MATTSGAEPSGSSYRRRARYDDEEDEKKRAEQEFMALVEETNKDEEEYVPVKRRRVKEMEERAMRLGKGLAVLKEPEAKEEEEEDAAAPGVAQVIHQFVLGCNTPVACNNRARPKRGCAHLTLI
eukprot:6968311-Pyramimonas_sp.AAC.1